MVADVRGVRNRTGIVGTLGITTVFKSGVVGVRVRVGSLATLGSVAVVVAGMGSNLWNILAKSSKCCCASVVTVSKRIFVLVVSNTAVR